MQNDNVLTAEHREQLELIERCQPDLLLMYIRENTAFDVALLERVFELAKERARTLLATPLPEPRAEVTDFGEQALSILEELVRMRYQKCRIVCQDNVSAVTFEAARELLAARTGASS